MNRQEDARIAALQDEICAVQPAALRLWKRALLLPIPVLMPLPMLSSLPILFGGLDGAALFLGLVALVVLQAAALGTLVWGPRIALHRARRRKELRISLGSLPREQQAAILLPLRDDHGVTGSLARRLIRDPNLATELSPADPPPGRGDEVTSTP